jgi:hypothetical protein
MPVTFNILCKYIMMYIELDVPLKQGSECAISYSALSALISAGAEHSIN